MDTFVKDSFKQYKGQTNLRKEFANYNDQVYEFFHDAPIVKTFIDTEKGAKEEDFFLCLVEPVIEVAWADGRVTSREMDALIQIADSYGLVDCEMTYCKLMNTLISRPIPSATARAWTRLYKLLDLATDDELKLLSDALLAQAQFVAQRSSNNLIDFLRGDSICRDEMAVLEKIREALALAEFYKREEKSKIIVSDLPDGSRKSKAEINQLLPLVPLVKVAWAEGRVTNREKQIIFEAAYRSGIMPETSAHQKLNEWLEIHPTNDFYNESLTKLKEDWGDLDSELRAFRKFDLLSDCALIAEASGGNSDFPGGGPRVCDEEIFAVKQIARKLKINQTIALA